MRTRTESPVPLMTRVGRALSAILGGFIVCALSTDAHAVTPTAITFNHDIAPLIYANCAGCHHEGEAAPFSLVTYPEIRKRAEQITDVTARRIMPPWKAEFGHERFVGERHLTDLQIELIRQWVKQGCAEGNPADAPAIPKFPAGWRLGEPDLVVQMPEAYSIPAEGRDIYRCFVIPVQIPAGKYIRAAEFRPGNRRVVHHAVLTTLSKPAVKKKLTDEPADAGPGFRTGLAAPGDRLPGALGIWVPGMDPWPLPEGMAMPWPAESDLILQLHLHPNGKAQEERSMVGLYLTDEKPTGQLWPIVLMNRKVDIAAGDKDYRLAKSVTLPRDVEVVGAFPHMHLLGRTTRITATLPDGKVKPMLSITAWDFRWQGYYRYATPLRLPAGTRLDAEWTFDNSPENPAQPSTPPRRVRFGEQTTDEMGVFILDVAAVQSGSGGKGEKN